MPGITFTVTAEAAKATAEVNQFFLTSARGAEQLAASARKAEAATTAVTSKILTNNRALKSAISGLALNATMFAGPQAQNIIYPLILMQKELKGLTSAAKLAGVSIPAVGVAVIGITAAVATGVAWWQKYKAELLEIKSQGDLALTEGNNWSRLLRLVEANKDRLKPGESEQLYKDLNSAAPGSDALRIIEARVRERLHEVVITKEQKEILDEIYDRAHENNVAQQNEFDQLADKERLRFEAEKVRLAEAGKFIKTDADYLVIQKGYDDNRRRNEFEIAKIEDDRHKKAAAAQHEITEEIRRREKAADEFYKREDEHLRQKKIQEIQNSPFISDANKFRMIGGEGADPNSLPQQMAASWVNLQNQIGTVSQNIASTFNNVVGGSISNISAGISGIIKGTTTWSQVLANIGSSVLDQVVDGIVKMFVAWIAGDRAKSIATRATAAGDAAAKAPVALFDSISSFGVAAAVGVAALLAAMAMMGGFSDGGPISGAFARGGRPPSGRPALVGERGPELFVPDSAGTIMTANQTSQIMRSGGGSGGSGMKNIHVHLDKRAWLAAVEDDIEAIAVRAIHRSRST